MTNSIKAGAMGHLNRALYYLCDEYAHVRGDVYHKTSERQAAEILRALLTVVMYSS